MSVGEPDVQYEKEADRVADTIVKEAPQTIFKPRATSYDNHIVFATGQYAPQTIEARKLGAHQLNHVVQQSGQKGVPRPKDTLSFPPAVCNRPIDGGKKKKGRKSW